MILYGGTSVINKYEVGRSLWKGIAGLHCLYGAEMIKFTERDILGVYWVHAELCKKRVVLRGHVATSL